MKSIKLFAVLAFVLSLSTVNSVQAQTNSTHCDILYAGQSIAVGSVCVTVNANDVNLDYLLTGDWKLTEAHAWIGDSLSSLPTNAGGNPQIGLFPYQASNISSASQYTFTIPISQLAVNADTFCNAEVFVAAHAIVKRTLAGGGSGSADGSHDGKSDKSSKSGKSGKSVGNDKNSTASKGDKNSASTSSKGTAYSATSSNSAGKSKAVQTSKSKPSGKSNKSGKSGDQSGGGSQPSTQTESAWAGTMQISNGGSWASYFSFTNDFCVDTDPVYPVVVLPLGCFNVFGQGVTSSTEPVAVTSFTPVGVTGSSTAWMNTFSSSTDYFSGNLIRADGSIIGGFIVDPSNSALSLEITPDVNASPSLKVLSANVYFDTAGNYVDMSPLDYGVNFIGNNTSSLVASVPLLFLPEQIDTIVHAVVCNSGNE